MNRKDKHIAIKRIGWLEEMHCDRCDNKLIINNNSHTICKDCPVYQELRALGDYISPPDSPNRNRVGRPRKTISVKDFVGYRLQGLTQAEIAKKFGLSANTISSFQYNHKQAIQAYVDELGVTLPQYARRGRKKK